MLRILGLKDLAGKGAATVFSFWALVLLTFFLFGDQNLIAGNISRIGSDFGFPDKETYLWKLGSLVSLCFFIVGGAISIYAGVLNDKFSAQQKKTLLIVTVIIGEASCLLSAFSPNFEIFLILRTLTGIGLGGLYPVLFSLLSDLFRNENRPVANGWLGLAMGLGIACGQLLGGALAHWEFLGMSGWRWSFVFMAVPSFPLLLAYYIWGKTPKRGQADMLQVHASDSAEVVEVTHNFNIHDLRKIFSIPSNLLAFMQSIPGCVPWGLMFVYFVDFYEKTRGFHVQTANLLVVAFGGMAIFGVFLGGILGGWLYRKSPKLLPYLCGGSILLGSLPVFGMVNFSGNSISIPLVFAVLAGLIVPMTSANVRAVLMNSNLPEQRGAVFALFNLTDDLGKGLGPFFVGLLLLVFDQVTAFNIAVAFWIPAGLIWLFLPKYIENDEKKVSQIIAARI